MATAIPLEMRAAAFDEFGPPAVVHTEVLPVPELGKTEVLVQTAIAGVGTWDPDLVEGAFHDAKARFPRVIGSDGAGTVVAIGDGVTRFSVGDRVYGWGFGNAKGGFYAEYAAIKERDLAPIPGSITLEEAGALAVAGITAMQGLDALELERGDRVVIFGASGGLGHVAVQLAKIEGLRVFAVCSRDDGVELARTLGADAVADGHSRSLQRELRDFAPDGFDGALVFTGGRGWKRALQLVKPHGAIAFPDGVEPRPAIPRGRRREMYDGKDSRAAFARLGALVDQGPFHVELSRTYSLDDAASALRDVQHHHLGKLAIEIAPPA
jgi:NADPH:quinone reductase-like Zn-dependent oxidoreductase